MPGGSKNEIRKMASPIKHEGLGRSDKPDWATVRASISFIKTNSFCYTACPLMIGDIQCSKKVTRSRNSRWQRNRCNQEFDECDYRCLLQVQIQGPHKISDGLCSCSSYNVTKRDCFLEYFHVSNDSIVLSEQQNKREVVFL